MEVYKNDQLMAIVSLRDSPLIQEFKLDTPLFITDKVVLKPITYYPGEYSELAFITEIPDICSVLKKIRACSGNSIRYCTI